MMFCFFNILLVIILLLMMISWLISFKASLCREKLVPFECGFDPLVNYQVSMYISFYLFSLIFLIFDVEVVLLFPAIVMVKSFNLSYISMMLFLYFMMLLVWGLLVEYIDTSLEWSL